MRSRPSWMQWLYVLEVFSGYRLFADLGVRHLGRMRNFQCIYSGTPSRAPTPPPPAPQYEMSR